MIRPPASVRRREFATAGLLLALSVVGAGWSLPQGGDRATLAGAGVLVGAIAYMRLRIGLVQLRITDDTVVIRNRGRTHRINKLSVSGFQPPVAGGADNEPRGGLVLKGGKVIEVQAFGLAGRADPLTIAEEIHLADRAFANQKGSPPGALDGATDDGLQR